MAPKVIFTVETHLKSSLEIKPQDNHCASLNIETGTSLVIVICREVAARHFTCDTGYTERLWLELPEEGLDIGEDEKVIEKWSVLAFQVASMRIVYFSTKGEGNLKISKHNHRGFFGGRKTVFHGSSCFQFVDPLYDLSKSEPERNINWIF